MYLPTQELQKILKGELQARATALAHHDNLGKLVSIIVGENPEQESYVKIKKKIGLELGIEVEKVSVPAESTMDEFVAQLRTLSEDARVSGIIIQQPLPRRFKSDILYGSIPTLKEIEGHRVDSQYIFPLVQACMIGLWWARRTTEIGDQPLTETDALRLPFQTDAALIAWLKGKSVALAGNGITTGLQIARHLKALGIPFLQTNSKSRYPDGIYSKADIIVSGVGKKVITAENIKPGVILLNFGLRKISIEKEGSMVARLRGDYDEPEIRDRASLYTRTPGGLGPIDVLCLFGNFLHACETAARAKESNT